MTMAEESGTSNVMAYQYDPLSRRTNLNFRAGVATSSYGYTNAGDLLTLDLTTTSGVVPNYTLTYTNAHQLLSEASSQSSYVWEPAAAGTDNYGTANNLNQYPSWTPNGGTSVPFTYDGNGNMTGGTIAGSTWAMAYDPENRLVTASKTGVAATYAYDPLGRRNHKSGTGVTETYFLDDGADELAEYNSAGAVAMRYIPGPAIDEPILSVTGSGTHRFIQTDHHGSVIAVASLGGAETEGPYLYDSYGNCFVGTTPCNTVTTSVPYKYVGMRLDAETGFYFDRARFYSSIVGRYLQTDPIGYTADLNLYTYGGNDPTDESDPTGLDTGCGSGNTGSRIVGEQPSHCEGEAAYRGGMALAARSGGSSSSQPARLGLAVAYTSGETQLAQLDDANGAEPGDTAREIDRDLDPENKPPQGTNLPQTYWPPNGGFFEPTRLMTLEPGEIISRYGPPDGRYAAPDAIPFFQRGLPEEAKEAPYNRFEVIKPLPGVRAGPSAPWFGQFGGGTQYLMPQSMRQLEQQGYIRPIK
jgi:RHS repeat-associated protein